MMGDQDYLLYMEAHAEALNKITVSVLDKIPINVLVAVAKVAAEKMATAKNNNLPTEWIIFAAASAWLTDYINQRARSHAHDLP